MNDQNFAFYDSLSKEEIIQRIEANEIHIGNVCEKWGSDKDVVLALAKEKEWMIEYVDKKFLDDKDVMLEVIKKKALYFVISSDRLKNDKDVVREVIKNSPVLFRQASSALKEDKEFLLEIAAMPRCYSAFAHVSEKLLDNYEFMSKAIQISIELFELASNNLKKNKTFVMEAVKKDVYSFFSASENLWNDLDILRLLKGRESEVSIMYADFYDKRMEFLEKMDNILEDDAWMRNNISLSTQSNAQKVKKF